MRILLVIFSSSSIHCIPTEARKRILFRCLLFENLTFKKKARKQLQIGSRELFSGYPEDNTNGLKLLKHGYRHCEILIRLTRTKSARFRPLNRPVNELWLLRRSSISCNECGETFFLCTLLTWFIDIPVGSWLSCYYPKRLASFRLFIHHARSILILEFFPSRVKFV